MADVVNVGTGDNKGNGDSLRVAFTNINEKFSEIDTVLGLGNALRVPPTSKGQAGDLQGMYSFNSEYMFYCIADYTNGTADIWVRTAWLQDTWDTPLDLPPA